MSAHWWLHWLGMDNGSGPVYLAWSGWGGDLSTLAILGGVGGLLRRHNCHVHRCWRMGRFPVDGTAYIVCKKHHPDGVLTHEHLLRRHREHQAAQAKAPPGQVAVDSPVLPDPRKLRRPGGRRM